MNNHFIIQALWFFCSFNNELSAASARASASSSFAIRVLICSSYVFSSAASLFCNILLDTVVVVVAAAVVVLQSQFAHGSAVLPVDCGSCSCGGCWCCCGSSLGAGKQEDTRWTHTQ